MGRYKAIPRDQWKIRVIKLTVEQRADICSGYQAGSSLKELARAYRVGYRTVRYHILAAGISMRPSGGRYR